MATLGDDGRAQFRVVKLIRHKLFPYRGVIVDVDPEFSNSEEWYEMMAKSRPPKDQPWYHVLVHDAEHVTYVAERNLEADSSEAPVDHPLIERFFSGIRGGCYITRQAVN